jgi:hypothetical protein
MLTAAQQYAIDQFAKGLLALDDDALIDTYHHCCPVNKRIDSVG